MRMLSCKLVLLLERVSRHEKTLAAHYTLFQTDYKCNSLVLAFQLMRIVLWQSHECFIMRNLAVAAVKLIKRPLQFSKEIR